MFGANSRPLTGRLRNVRRLLVGTSAALSMVLLLGVGTAVAAPVHAGGGWGRASTTTPAAKGSFGVYLPAHNLTQGDIALQFAMSQVGKPYLYGGAGPDRVRLLRPRDGGLGQGGVSLDHYTGYQVHEGAPVARANLRPGDLVFFGTASDVYHVGLYVSGDQGGLMVDAPHTGAFVRVEQIWWSDYYTRSGRLLAAGPISAAWTSAGRPAACRRSDRSRSTAGSCPRRRPAGSSSPQRGQGRPVRACTLTAGPLLRLQIRRAEALGRLIASRSVPVIASYSVAARRGEVRGRFER